MSLVSYNTLTATGRANGVSSGTLAGPGATAPASLRNPYTFAAYGIAPVAGRSSGPLSPKSQSDEFIRRAELPREFHAKSDFRQLAGILGGGLLGIASGLRDTQRSGDPDYGENGGAAGEGSSFGPILLIGGAALILLLVLR